MKRICLLLLISFPLLVGAQEKVFYNARIFTADPQQPFAEAIAINGKTITAVGNYTTVKKKAGAHAEWIDLNGGFLMPGFVDSHNHGINAGRTLTKANVNDQSLTVDEIQAYAKTQLAKKEGMTGDVLVIYGLNIGTWKWLDELNRVFNSDEFETQPLVLRGSDGHT